MLELTPVLVLAIIFGAIFGIVYLSIRKKERMAMMEKGVDASAFITKKRSDYSLKYGLLLVGVALGILIGNILSNLPSFEYVQEAAYFSMIFLFGGLSLVIYHFLTKKQLKEEEEKEDKNQG